MYKLERANAGGNRKGSGNHLITGGNQTGFLFESTKKSAQKQDCALCRPSPETKPHSTKFCDDCTAKGKQLENVLFAHISQNRTVRRLHRCDGCGECFASEKFSIFWNVCKRCVREAKGKSKLAQSNFIERALNNFRKNLRGALCQ